MLDTKLRFPGQQYQSVGNIVPKKENIVLFILITCIKTIVISKIAIIMPTMVIMIIMKLFIIPTCMSHTKKYITTKNFGIRIFTRYIM